jgi:hypothetical protein
MGFLIGGVLLLLVILVLFVRFMIWPLLQSFGVLLGAAVKGRGDMDPRTPQGRWRLLGIGWMIAAMLLILQARGYDVLVTILAWINIDAGSLGTTLPSIFGLFAGAFVFILLAGRSFTRAKRFDSRLASKLVSEDTRSPIVYLRSFSDDPRAGRHLGMASFSVNTEEGELAELVKDIGPLVAIGRPNEELPYYGAARTYVGEADWQARVTRLLSQAPLVMVRAGTTPGLWWEVQECVKRVSPEKLVVLISGNRRMYDEFCRMARDIFPCRLPEYNGRMVGATTLRAVLYFDRDWTPHLRPVVPESTLVYWLKLMASFFYRENVFTKKQSDLRRILEGALQPVVHRPADETSAKTQ